MQTTTTNPNDMIPANQPVSDGQSEGQRNSLNNNVMESSNLELTPEPNWQNCQIDSDSVSASSPSDSRPEPLDSRKRQVDPQRGTHLKGAYRAMVFLRRAATTLHLNRSSETMNKNKITRADESRQSTDCEQRDKNRFNDSSLAPEAPKFLVPKMNHLKLPIVCMIRSVEGELMREVFVHQFERGQHLMENLKVYMGLLDTKYYGLKLCRRCDDQEDINNPWIDLNETICKQIKRRGILTRSISEGSSNNNNYRIGSSDVSSRSLDFYLKIKFYPPNLYRIKDSFLRNYLWLQLKRDLRLGKLTSSRANLTYLMACIMQYEIGDYNSEHLDKISNLNILPNQDLIEDQAIELWRLKLKGIRKCRALLQFLRASMILETYGFDHFQVRDHQRQRAYLLGFNYAGVKTIRNGRIVHHFRWHNINKISHERRMIIFHVHPKENSMRKQILGFKCLSNDDCQTLLLLLLEQKYFFTVDLAYFDKQHIPGGPSCLHSSSASFNDWNSMSNDGASLQTRMGDSKNISNQHQISIDQSSSMAINDSGQSFCQSCSRSQDLACYGHHYVTHQDCCQLNDDIYISDIDIDMREHEKFEHENNIEYPSHNHNKLVERNLSNPSADDTLMDHIVARPNNVEDDYKPDSAIASNTNTNTNITSEDISNRITKSEYVYDKPSVKENSRHVLVRNWMDSSHNKVAIEHSEEDDDLAINLSTQYRHALLAFLREYMRLYVPTIRDKLSKVAGYIMTEIEATMMLNVLPHSSINDGSEHNNNHQPQQHHQQLQRISLALTERLKPALRFGLLVIMVKLVLTVSDTISSCILELIAPNSSQP